MDKGWLSWKRRIQSWMWPESTRENYFFENERAPYVYVFPYLASIAICTSGIELEMQAVFLSGSGIFFHWQS